MRKNWTGKVIWGVNVLVATIMICPSAKADEKSAALYKQKCVMCHGADGKGETPAGKAMKARDFHSPDVAKETDAELAEIVKKGKGKMPAYGSKLSDEEIKGVIEYIRSLK